MIARYSLPDMARLWSEEAKFQRWLEVELAAVSAREKNFPQEVPAGTTSELRSKCHINVSRIDEIEATTNHDVIAFVTQVAETCGEPGRHIHYGMTSSDVVDTALGLALRDACDLLLARLDTLLETTRALAKEHHDTEMMGRTHGMHAEPTTFGIKVAGWVDELSRNRERLLRAKAAVAVGKLSGAVGTYTLLPPDVEAHVMKELNLAVATHSTQIVPRDRHAELLSTLALLGGALERIALEIRHGQRTELGELSEPFGRGQRGSSAMPHKKNPILCERICGGARVLRGYALTGFENIALWMERDISHSSTERIIFPDAFLLMDYLLSIAQKILSGIVVDRKRMKTIVRSALDLHLSQRILSALVAAGKTRNESYEVVQSAAFTAREKKKSLLKIAAEHNWWGLPPEAIAEISNLRPGKYWRTILKRAGV
ncbi:MAG: adenylosuccinate lyase [bacterium]|nr:adenylosuccinate lyase [bacterium]